MSPHAVLPGDAMKLASQLCPDAASVRVRIDCSTPHDVLTPLTTINKLRELSMVCVTSGERCNLDFSDITPILEVHGQTSLTSLELKVKKVAIDFTTATRYQSFTPGTCLYCLALCFLKKSLLPTVCRVG